MSSTQETATFEFISYADFGTAFFERAVNIETIRSNFSDLAGQESTIGPISADRIGVVKVNAKTRTNEPTIERGQGANITYTIALPIDLELDVTVDVAPKSVRTLGGLLPEIDFLGGRLDPSKTMSYRGTVVVNLTLTARAAKPLLIVIDIKSPSARDVDVDIQADGFLAGVLQQGGILEGEIKKAVSTQVRGQLSDPKRQAGLVIDVGARLDKLS